MIEQTLPQRCPTPSAVVSRFLLLREFTEALNSDSTQRQFKRAKRIKLRQQRWPRPLLSEPAEHSATCQSVCHFEKIPPADFPFSLNKNYNAARIKPRLVKWSTWPRGLVVKFKPELPQLVLFTFSLCNASGLGVLIYVIRVLCTSIHLLQLKHNIPLLIKTILQIKTPLQVSSQVP